MRDITKYQGVIPAFYACYDEKGDISPEGVEKLTRFLIEKGVKGVYVGGSSGECIYQGVAERKLVLEHVMKAAEGRLTVIAHVACNNTTRRAWAWTPSRRFLLFISISRSTPSPSIGMISPPRLRTRTL